MAAFASFIPLKIMRLKKRYKSSLDQFDFSNRLLSKSKNDKKIFVNRILTK